MSSPARARVLRTVLAVLLGTVGVAGCGLLADGPCDSDGCMEEMAAVERTVEQDDRVLEVQEAIYLPLSPGIGQSQVRVTVAIEPEAADEADDLRELVRDAVEEQQIEDLEEVVLRLMVRGEELPRDPGQAEVSTTARLLATVEG